MAAKILIVEDNANNRLILHDILSFYKYEVLEADNGVAAIDLAKKDRPDLILMDLQMPAKDGFEALAELRKEPSISSVPIIAVTASAMPADRAKVLAAGFDGYVTKPFEVKEIAAVVKQHLERK
ncbi:MAG TPA: response regulator [Elusimicrobiales bacterium]|nr:response regulator [Elusimicrobiales bacterium]